LSAAGVGKIQALRYCALICKCQPNLLALPLPCLKERLFSDFCFVLSPSSFFFFFFLISVSYSLSGKEGISGYVSWTINQTKKSINGKH